MTELQGNRPYRGKSSLDGGHHPSRHGHESIRENAFRI